jgi:YYY domain-containing protein
VDVAGQGPVKQEVGFETINEFPLFSFVINDMHPHVMALPLVLLAASFAIAVARRRILRGSRWLDGLPRGWAAWLTLVVMAVALGALYAANTWDYPTYVLLSAIGLAVPLLAHQRQSDRPYGWQWLKVWLIQSALLIGLSLIAFALFHLTFKSLVGGQAAPVPDNLREIPVVGWVLERLSGLLLVNTADKTITGFVVIFGVFLVAIAGWLVYEVWRYLASRRNVGDISIGDWSLGAVAGAAILVAVLLRFPLLGLLLPIGYTCFYILWRSPGDRVRAMALGMAGTAALIGLAVEIVYLKDVFSNRMNTLFKFYYQMWVIWGVIAAYGMWRVISGLFQLPTDGPNSRQSLRNTDRGGQGLGPLVGKSAAVAWAIVFGFLMISSLSYLYFGPLASVGWQGTMRGLDGIEHLSRSAPGDYDAIRWLRANGTGRDVVLECCRDEYNNPGHAGRVSSYTGIPTLISWDGHESQWRGGQPELLSLSGERRALVNAIYQGNAPADSPQGMLNALRQNQVTLVFVGAVERGDPGATGAFAEERITGRAEGFMREVLTEAFRSGTTVIYRVPPDNGASGGVRAP